MDTIKQYQDIIIGFLKEYAAIPYANTPNIEKQIISDKENHHYQLVAIGWEKDVFVHDTLFHFDIKAGKVWIQQNWTELQIADELISRGVSPSDIVLGFQPPYVRAVSGFALS